MLKTKQNDKSVKSLLHIGNQITCYFVYDKGAMYFHL